MHKKKTLSQQDKDYFLSLKPDDIDLNLLHDLFTDTYNRKAKKIQPSKFNTYDEFILTPKDYFVKSEVLTNCGLFIFNKFLFELELQDIVGYVNVPIDKKQLNKINGKLIDALLIDQITSDTYINYLNRLTWLAFTFNTEISTSLTVGVLQENPAIAKEKKRLMEGKYKEAIANNDAAMVAQMEAELVKVAEKELADDPALDLYKSGARGSMDSYKVSQIMKGPVYNESKHQYEIVTKGLSMGIDKKDVPVLANSMILGQYNKSVAPGDCGYLTKKLSAAFQSVVMDKKGTDCGTKMYSTVTLTPDTLFPLSSCTFTRISNSSSSTAVVFNTSVVKLYIIPVLRKISEPLNAVFSRRVLFIK